MKEKIKTISICLLLFLLCFGPDWYRILIPNQEVSAATELPPKPDTVYIQTVQKEFIQIPAQKEYVPQKVYIYLPDTNRRKQLEQDTLISGISIKKEKLEIHKITPLGISITSTYNLPKEGLTELEIDSEGKLAIGVDEKAAKKERKRKRWRKVGNSAIAVGAFVIGVIIAK